MISADFTRENEGDRLYMTLQGHANYADDGRDIVCAAVSGLFYALCGYLANLEGGDLVLEKAIPGDARLSCAPCGVEAMRLVCIGLIQIMLSYPGCLSVTNSAFDWSIAPIGADRSLNGREYRE